MSDGLQTLEGKIEPIELEDEMRSSFIDYAMSVLTDRALPDVRDGLKPSQRRILVAMNDLGLAPNKQHRKCAKIAGDTSGNYHPHGEAVIYPTLVRMAQDFNMRYTLVDGQGNFGSVEGDSPAAMRYTEARFSKIAVEMLRDLDANTVDWMPNYDETRREPKVLPSRMPNLMVNGASGIAVGMATNIPPHNLGEVVDAIEHLIDNPEATADDLMQFIKGPDFPTGGVILGTGGFKEAYRTGRGRIRVRAKAHTESAEGQSQRHHRHRAAVPGEPRVAHRQHRRPGQDQEDHRDQRPAQRVGPQRHAPGHRAQARSHPHGGAQQALQAHPDADHLRGHQHRPRRRCAAHPHAAGDAAGVHRLPERDRHPAHQVRAGQGRDQGPHPRGPAGRARQPRPDHRHHPPRRGRRQRARGAHGHVRAHAAAGAGHPRPAAPEAHQPRARQGQGGARRPAGAHQGAPRAARRRRRHHGRHQGRAGRDQAPVQRRPAHRDRAGRRRDRPRRPHRRRADGHHRHQDRVREAHPGRHLPPAEARRHRRGRHGAQGRGRGRAPLHHEHPQLPAVLHQRRQGVPAQGARAAAGRPQRQGQAHRQPLASPSGRARSAPSSTRATSTRARASS